MYSSKSLPGFWKKDLGDGTFLLQYACYPVIWGYYPPCLFNAHQQLTIGNRRTSFARFESQDNVLANQRSDFFRPNRAPVLACTRAVYTALACTKPALSSTASVIHDRFVIVSSRIEHQEELSDHENFDTANRPIIYQSQREYSIKSPES